MRRQNAWVRSAASLLVGLAVFPSLVHGAEPAKPGGAAFSGEVWTMPGYDSNVYQAPGEPYTDYFADFYPEVNPQARSGQFLDLALDLRYQRPMGENDGLEARYDFNGRKHLAEELSAADVNSHKLQLGWSHMGGRDSQTDLGLYLKKRQQAYVDHDLGGVKLIDGTDVSNRYNYLGRGLVAKYGTSAGEMDWKVSAELETRDYEDPVVVSQYDQSRRGVQGDVRWKLSAPLSLRVNLGVARVDYDDRPAKNEKGEAFSSHPRLSYTYQELGGTLRNRFSNGLIGYMDLTRTNRMDDYVHYNDYTEDQAKLRIRLKGGKDLRIRLVLQVWRRDYPNAYAFDNPYKGPLEYTGTKVGAKGNWELNRQFELMSQVDYTDQNSTDLRYQYQQFQVMAGVGYKF